MLNSIKLKQNRIELQLFVRPMLQAKDFSEEEITQILEIAGHALGKVSSCFLISLSKEQLFERGLRYYKMMPKNTNVPIAKEYFHEAYMLGDCEAGYHVATMYLRGKYIARDTKLGISMLKEMANKNHAKSQYMFGKELLSGINTQKNEEKALSWIVKAANNGLIDSQFFLGNYYRDNDPTKAFYWYAMAAEANEPSAAYEVALAYAMGKGTKRDMKKAKEWLIKAANTGHLEAKKKLQELGVYN